MSFLHRLLTCDVKGLPVGGVAPGLLLTAKGRVVADFLLAVLPDRVEMIADGPARRLLRAGLGKFVIADDVALEDLGETDRVVLLLGPRAEAAAARAAGVPAVLIRGRRAGLPSVELLVGAGDLPALRAAAEEAARAEGGAVLDDAALEALRVENGVPRLGAEFGEETLPQEAGLEDLVSFTKGCFLGQEPVARLKTQGHTNRGLAGILPESLPAAGDAILAGGKEVGAVTSALLSPTLGRPVALALLRHGHAAPGTALEVRTAGGTVPASVARLPFVE